MDKNSDQPKPTESSEDASRREALAKLGKFSAFAAPFSVLAFTKKAAAATGHGPAKHN